MLHSTLNFNTDSGGDKMHSISLETLYSLYVSDHVNQDTQKT